MKPHLNRDSLSFRSGDRMTPKTQAELTRCCYLKHTKVFSSEKKTGCTTDITRPNKKQALWLGRQDCGIKYQRTPVSSGSRVAACGLSLGAPELGRGLLWVILVTIRYSRDCPKGLL